MKKLWMSVLLVMVLSMPLQADEYMIDHKGAHASIQFKISHLGYSWLLGRFNHFEGSFQYDEKNPEASSAQVNIDMNSIDSNHAERDKHLRGKDFFDVNQFPKATFKSTAFKVDGEGKAVMHGELALRGVTKNISIQVHQIGAGSDPWGGYRRGFEGKTSIVLKDYGIDFDLGPASKQAEVYLFIEGIRK